MDFGADDASGQGATVGADLARQIGRIPPGCTSGRVLGRTCTDCSTQDDADERPLLLDLGDDGSPSPSITPLLPSHTPSAQAQP